VSKKIIFCADGTWNHPHDPKSVTESDTNVYKLFKLLKVTSSQLPIYDDGVGVSTELVSHFLGGAFGTGLFQKIKDGYTAFAHNYEKGDEIFIFGFSRGAYTARSLAGMIAACGLPTGGFDDNLVETAFRAYRDKDEREAILAGLARYSLYHANITMLGVWDTVGALGIPGALFGVNDSLLYGFLDTGLNRYVLNAYHALSIDERRSEFVPTLWTSAPAPGQTMQQVWFSGVHSDVGGGYSDCGLSTITLSWMLSKAIKLNVDVIPDVLARYSPIDPKHALDALHESWNVLWGFPKRREIPAGSYLSDSVIARYQEEHVYRPPNLSRNAAGLLEGYTFEPVVGIPSTATAAGV